MPAPTPSAASPPRGEAWAALLLLAAVALAYANSLAGPFVFDDVQAIVENPSLRRLGSIEIWQPPAGLTVSGRPLANVSLALNHAVGGTNPHGYHAANLTIHAAAALVLFGLLRRTFQGPKLAQPPRTATALALGTALLWALHPLQTAAVTYVIQRTESLMALCYLFTLYAVARSGAAPGRRWPVAAVIACAAGMATKETMATAPLVALLYDRAFLARSWREVWQRRRGLHAGLAATGLLLAWLVWRTGDRAGTAGFSAGITLLQHVEIQLCTAAHYLRTACWPFPLVFDAGAYRPPPAAAALFAAASVALTAGAVAVACRRRPGAAMTALMGAIALAPALLVPIPSQPMAEHRLYLPLAAPAALFMAGLHALAPRASSVLAGALALALGLLTAARNDDYRTARGLWQATVAAVPENPRAHSSLAWALAEAGDAAGAEASFKAALALQPAFRDALHGLAGLLEDQGRLDEAAALHRATLAAFPGDFVALSGLGYHAFQRGDLAAAQRAFAAAVESRPDSAIARNNLGGLLLERGEIREAQAQLEIAVRLAPDYAEAHYNLGNAHARQQQADAARVAYERALALRPDYPEAHANLGLALQSLGDPGAAIVHYREALRLRPDFTFAQEQLRLLLRPR